LINQPDDIDEINEISIPDVEPPPDRDCTIWLKLSGPHSPLETKLRSIVRSGGQKSITIESESVNSVLLNTDPQVSLNLT
jgi:ATP-dependent RNA helicase TDRD9